MKDTWAARLASLLLVLLISAFAYNQYGFNGLLTRDDAIYLYSGQQMAAGVPPYVSIFDHKGPLAPMLSGIGVMLSQWIHTDDVLTVRATFFVVSLLTVISLYLLAFTLFDAAYQVAFLASFTFINFWGFGRHAASGPRAKTLMLLFETLAILLTVRRMWFWAGFCGSLAFLTWQPTIIYPLLTILLAITQSTGTKDRRNHLVQVAAGLLAPLIAVSAYFIFKDAFAEFLDGFILFNLTHLNRPGDTSILASAGRILLALFTSYTTMSIPLLVGLVAILAIFKRRVGRYKNDIRLWLSEDPFGILLLSFPFPVIWSLVDFQGYADFYIFLPYAAIGFGWLVQQVFRSTKTKSAAILSFVLCAVLIVTAMIDYHRTSTNEFKVQRAWADEVDSRFDNTAQMVSLGVPEAMVLLRQTNPNPYLFLINGIDNRVDTHTPGGFDQWLEDLHQPDVIFYGPTNGRFKPVLDHWLEAHYRETMIGGWKTYVEVEPLE